jgi:mono/diheme cytochrome c family protein
VTSARGTWAALLAIVLAGASACTKPALPSPVPDASTQSASVVHANEDGRPIVKGACLSCHAEEMLAQQRLPKEKWAATVKKMSGWGANLDPSDTDALVAYLAASYGPDAGPWEPATISAADATEALEAQDDGAYAGGDAATGAKLFIERCAPCHGANARGAIGVNLVDRPLLYRADYVATTVRTGRGKMLPLASTTDRDIADILAHLRTLRVP